MKEVNAPFRATRRRFLTASAALAAPTIIAASAIGADGKTAASERITIGMIGTGKMCSGYHMGTLLGFDDVQIVAVAECDSTRREIARKRIAEKNGGRTSDVHILKLIFFTFY